MQGKATVAKHPLHPMLVSFPIGFFVGALVCDIVSIWGDPTFWPRMSEALIGFGVISALLAAVFGFVDYLSAPMSAAAKKIATTHMILNLCVVALFVAAFFVRFGDLTSTLGYVLTVAGVIVLAAAGWYGGHLAYVGLVGTTSEPQGEVEGRIVGARTTTTVVPH